MSQIIKYLLVIGVDTTTGLPNISEIPEIDPDELTDSGFWIAKSLSMKIVAEGVKEREQVELLKRLRCDFIQGYVFAKPMPVYVSENFLKLQQVRNSSYTRGKTWIINYLKE